MRKLLMGMGLGTLGGVGLWFVSARAAGPGVLVRTVAELESSILCNILGYMFKLFLIVAVAMILWAAFNYVTSGEDSEKVAKGHKGLTWAIIALVVAVLSYSVPTIVSKFVGGEGYQICG